MFLTAIAHCGRPRYGPGPSRPPSEELIYTVYETSPVLIKRCITVIQLRLFDGRGPSSPPTSSLNFCSGEGPAEF